MHPIRFRLGLRPRPRWGSLQRSPRPPSWIERGLLLREGEGGKGKVGKGGEGRDGQRGEGKFAPAPSKYIWIDAAAYIAAAAAVVVFPEPRSKTG